MNGPTVFDLASSEAFNDSASLAPPRLQGGGVLAIGNGDYGFEIVSAPSHQNIMRATMAAFAQGSEQHECVAVLMPELDNPDDPGAVCVRIDTRRVGYLSPRHAADFNAALIKKGHQISACYARIVRRANAAENSGQRFAVELDIVYPFELQVAKAAHAKNPTLTRAQPMKITRRSREMLMTASALIVAVLIFLWAGWLKPTKTSASEPPHQSGSPDMPAATVAPARSP